MAEGAGTFAAAYVRDRNNFDLVRFMLATAVIWSHSVSLSGRDISYAAAIAVNLFFVVSGFLVMQSWLAYPRVGAYARKRALRIVPALALALAFGAFIVAPLGADEPARAYFGSAAPWRHVLSVVFHRWLHDETLFRHNPVPGFLNLPLWSLRYEVVCYALVPALALAAAPRRRVALVVALVGLCLAQPPPTLDGSGNVLHAHLFACFTAGACVYVFRDRIPHHIMLATIAAIVLVTSYARAPFRIALPLAGGYLVLYLACARWLPAHRFGRYGDFSYGLYVLAFPLQQLIVQIAGARLTAPRLFALAMASTLPVAIASWHFVEAPALARKPHPSHRPETASTPV